MDIGNRTLRIAFCGASGTGKTTLAKAIQQKYGLELNPVGSRSVSKAMGFDSPYDVDKASVFLYQGALEDGHTSDIAARYAVESWDPKDEETRETCRELFQRKLQLAKITWEDGHEQFVSDRSTIDDFCYTAMHNHKALNREFAMTAEQHMNQYDLVFATPVDSFINLGGDPSRLDNVAYHRAFEFMAFGALERWYPKAHFIPGHTRISRLKFVFRHIDALISGTRISE